MMVMLRTNTLQYSSGSSAWHARAHDIKRQTCRQMHTHQACSESWTHACRQWEAAFWHRLATIWGFFSLCRGPLAMPSLERGHILQGVSKQRWHVDVLALLSAPYHHISRPCQQSSSGCFLSLLFSSLFLLISHRTEALCQRKQNHCLF